MPKVPYKLLSSSPSLLRTKLCFIDRFWCELSTCLVMQEVIRCQCYIILGACRLVRQRSAVYKCFCSSKCSYELLVSDICISQNCINSSFCCLDHSLMNSTKMWCQRRVEMPVHASICCRLFNFLLVTSSRSSRFAPTKFVPLSEIISCGKQRLFGIR